MAATLTFLLISSLLEGALCGTFNIKMPKNINVLNGSCLTIPCSFDVGWKFQKHLDDTCRAYWSDSTSFTTENAKLKPTKDMTGDLTKKDCTTTFNHTSFLRSTKYYFRLGCGDTLKYSFSQTGVNISFIDHPPSPTLTSSTPEVKEGTSVSVTCSAPAPCWSHPPALTWTPNLGQSQETLQENQDKTKVKTSVMSFTASHLHHGNKISCTAVYRKQDGSPDVTAETSLTPVVSYSPKNITVSVSASGPVAENSNVSLTCSSNANPAVRNYTWYRADGDQETFIGTGTNLNTKVIRDRRTFFCKAENEIGVGHSNLAQLEIQFHPQILFSSDCVKTTSQVNCSCDTDGNPSPAVQWYLNGVAVNQSGGFEIFSETLNITVRRSFFILSQPQVKHLSTLLCHSFNSLGSASQQFCMSKLKNSAEHQGSVLYPVIVSTLAVLLLVLMCVLLFFIRALKNQRKPKVGLTGENITFVMSQLLTEEGNEATNTTKEIIYANADGLREADTLHPTTIAETSSTNLPSSASASAEAGSENSENKGDKCEVIYSSVNWKTKSKKKKEKTSLDMNSAGSSYLEEEKCMVEGINRSFVRNALQMGGLYDEVAPKNVKKEVKCEYAQVKFKDKSDMQK